MKTLFASLIFVALPLWSQAYDCTSAQPFTPEAPMTAEISVTKIYWDSNHTQQFQDLCSAKIPFNSYDVRGREEDAFYCLIPQKTEFLECLTTVDNSPGSIIVVPATWIRNVGTDSQREYRLHAYAIKAGDDKYVKDIFSRMLTTNLPLQDLTLEGALKTGASNRDDGFHIRVQFNK